MNNKIIALSSSIVLSIILFSVLTSAYDSGWKCMDNGFDSENSLSNYVVYMQGNAYHANYDDASSICGIPGHYTINFGTNGIGSVGTLVLKLPELPKTGEYTFSFKYEAGDDTINKEFGLVCQSDEDASTKQYHYFTESSGKDSEGNYKEVSVNCNFEKGKDNYVTFISMDWGSVHLEEFKVSAPSENNNDNNYETNNGIRVVGEGPYYESLATQKVVFVGGEASSTSEEISTTLNAKTNEINFGSWNLWMWIIIAGILILIVLIILKLLMR